MPKQQHSSKKKTTSKTKPSPARDPNVIVTPKGPIPKDQAHEVAPGQVVRGTGKGSYTLSAQDAPTPTPGKLTAAALGDYILTPGGYRHKSLVHEVPPGHTLRMTDARVIELVHPSGQVIANFGEIPLRTGNLRLMPFNQVLKPDVLVGTLGPPTLPALGTGWIANGDWYNTTGTPVSFFTTTWVVPPEPSDDDGQLVYLFNGLQNSTMIYQPVLQWGNNGGFGGSNWLVASWYADGQGGAAFYTSQTNVNPGDVLVGVMTLTGQSGTNFSYNCQFTGIANSALPISNVEELKDCVETLEAYTMTQCSDYPACNFTAFTAINIQTGTTTPALGWSAVNGVTDCGQHTVIVSNNNPGGEVDIYYSDPITWANPAAITYGTPLGAAQLNATASEAGNLAYSPPLGSCLPAGTHTLTVTLTPSDAGYQPVTKSVQLNVLKATPNIIWSNPPDIHFGDVLDSTELNATARWVVCGANVSVPGNFFYSPPAGTVLPAGLHALNVSLLPTDSANYNSAFATVQINVLKTTPTLTWANPADIDHGTALDATQLNATATAIVGGSIAGVPGTFAYTPPAGTVLGIGPNQALTVLFTPTDTADYNSASAIVHINVLTGYPIVMSVTFFPTYLQWNERAQVTVIVKNDSVQPHGTQGPNPGFEYSEGDTYQTKGYPSVAGAYRVGVDLHDTTYKVKDLYRWGFGHTLAPGETATVTGYIRFHNSRHNSVYFVDMIQEVDTILIEEQGPTGITVLKP